MATKEVIGEKPCKICGDFAVLHEKYCKKCRAQVIRDGKAATGIDDLIGTRTLSWRGTDEIGRKALPAYITATLGTDTDRTSARD